MTIPKESHQTERGMVASNQSSSAAIVAQKRFATLAARAALAGHTLTKDGPG